MPLRRLKYPLLILCALSLTLAAACLWSLNLFKLNQGDLVGVSQPAFSTYDCLVGGHLVRPGPTMQIITEWVIADDLVPVLAAFQRQGWTPSTHMATNIQMLPTAPTAVDVGLLRVRVFRALALSYTQAGTTRVVASTRVVACPP